jgi:hypothetical protein
MADRQAGGASRRGDGRVDGRARRRGRWPPGWKRTATRSLPARPRPGRLQGDRAARPARRRGQRRERRLGPCHYTGCTPAQAAKVIARLPAPGRSHVQLAGETATATWDGIEVEWHYQPPQEQPADPRQMTAALLAHLAVLGGRDHRKDDPT